MFRRVSGLAAAATLLAVSPAGAQIVGLEPAQAAAVDPIQQQFTEAMQAFEAGRADEAATILTILAARTDAPRIRLELARALYFQGRLKEARREFLKVYARGDLPYAVRRTINIFLGDIDQRAGYLQPTLALTYDSNPQQTPPSGIYDIFGIPLSYESDIEPQTGVRVDLQGGVPIFKTGISAIGSVGLTRYADPDFGLLTGSLGLRRPDKNRAGYFGGGVSYYERKGFAPATTAYVERVKRLTLPDQSKQLVVRASVSHITVKDTPNLNGWGADGGVDYGFDLNPNAAVNFSAQIGWAGAEYKVDRRTYGNLSSSLTTAMPKWNKTASFRATAGRTKFGDEDPFFGKQRDDAYYSVEARLLDGHPIHGLFPSVSLTWEQRSSSIDFFNYQRTGVNVGLQRRF